MSKTRRQAACSQLNKPGVIPQKDVECGVIGQRTYGQVFQEKENISPTRILLKRWQGNKIK